MTDHTLLANDVGERDPALLKIETVTTRVEQAVLDGYRRLLGESYAQSDQWCRLPKSMTEHFRRLLKRLKAGLFATIHDTNNLQIVSDYHEELRIRLMVLENLVDREVPWVYLERALNCAIDKVVLLDRNVIDAPSQGTRDTFFGGVSRVSIRTQKQGWWRRLFARYNGRRVPGKDSRRNLSVRVSADVRHRFEYLPDYLKRLSLIYHFMEMDDLNLLGAMRRVPSLGRHFSLQGTIAVFDAEDLGERHWGRRHRQGHGEPVARTVEELREKLRKRDYNKGPNSCFIEDDEANGRDREAASHLTFV